MGLRLLLPRRVDPLNQIVNDRARGEWNESYGGAECDLIAEHAWPPQRQDDAWRTGHHRIVDILDVAERDALLLAAFLHHQRVALFPDFVGEVEDKLLHQDIADRNH